MNIRSIIKLSCSIFAGTLLGFSSSFALAQANAVIRLMPLGDSITAGVGSSNTNGYRGPLFTQLSGEVAAVDFVGAQDDGNIADSSSEGHSGWRIEQISGIVAQSLQSYKPNVVTLLIGVNDLNQNYQVSTAPNRLATLIDQILQNAPDATLIVSQLIINSDSNSQAKINTFNAALPGIVNARANAGKHILLISMPEIKLANLNDGLHPNDSGYQLMANAWNAAILQVIAKGWVGEPLGGSISRPVGSIYSGLTGLCLDDLSGSATNGAIADTWTCNESASQHWNINQGRVRVNGLCLDVVGGGTANGSKVDLWNCQNTANQQWRYQNGTLVNPASGKCLEVPSFSTVPGTQLDIWDCNGGANQQWRIPTETTIAAGSAGKCLDVPAANNSNGSIAETWGCNGSAAQQWKVFNNTVQFGGKCLDASGGNTANGTPVLIWQCTGGANQIWKAQNNTLVNTASGRCLDDPSHGATSGTQLVLWDCNGGDQQRFVINNP